MLAAVERAKANRSTSLSSAAHPLPTVAATLPSAGQGTNPKGLRLYQPDSYTRVPSIVQPFPKFTADGTAGRPGLREPPCRNTPPSPDIRASGRPPTNERGVRVLQGGFGILSPSQADV